MIRLCSVFSVLVLLVFGSCESKEFLPFETHEGKNTFGFISPDMVKRGGNIDDNDTVSLNQGTGQFVFKLKSKSQSSWNKNGTWRLLDLYLTFNDYPSYHEYILDSAFYFERYYYDSSSELFIDYAEDRVYFLDPTKSTHFWVFEHQEALQQISGNFDFYLNPQKVFGDTSYIDTSESIQLRAGRFDVIYSLE